MHRRSLLAATALAPLAACRPGAGPLAFNGGWVGVQHARGHRLRETKSGALPAPEVQRHAGVLVVGAGVAGLACARALAGAGVDDVHVFDLEDAAGGNSRGHRMGGMACPLGAHYLPLPGEAAVEVIALLEELGLRRSEHGRAVYDERHLCHSPQERLCIDGHWHEGLLPPVAALPAAERGAALAQYRRFAARVAELGRGGADGKGHAFAIPTARAPWNATVAALDRIRFADWLAAESFDAPALRWYLNYCCRDDYGAGAAQVSAWAGIHYFASRHGFHAPGEESEREPSREGVLTWPEGNAWLAERLAAPLAGRVHTGMTALRVAEGRHAVEVDVWNEAARRAERWSAPKLVLALPLFIAARLLEAPPAALTQAVAAMRWAPWLVANLQLRAALDDRPGAPPSWDNVVYGASPAALGYVDAMHQSTRPFAGPTVLTAYFALGGDDAEQLRAQRAALLADPWRPRAEAVVRELSRVHADLPGKVAQVDLMRYGHAMAIPLPGARGSAALRALGSAPGGLPRRVHFAHADLSGYSVFEEALYHGQAAAAAIGVRQRGVA